MNFEISEKVFSCALKSIIYVFALIFNGAGMLLKFNTIVHQVGQNLSHPVALNYRYPGTSSK